MNLPELFLCGTTGRLLAWAAFLGLACRNGRTRASRALTLFDDMPASQETGR